MKSFFSIKTGRKKDGVKVYRSIIPLFYEKKKSFDNTTTIGIVSNEGIKRKGLFWVWIKTISYDWFMTLILSRYNRVSSPSFLGKSSYYSVIKNKGQIEVKISLNKSDITMLYFEILHFKTWLGRSRHFIEDNILRL